MSCPYIYIGCFVDFDALYELINRSRDLQNVGNTRLYRVIENPHVTFEYRPSKVDESLFGEEIEVRIVGYGNDGKNEGLKVELFASNAKLQDMIAGIEVPHITLSVSRESESVNTKYITYRPIAPMTMKGRFGAYTEDNKVVYKK